MPKVQVSFAIDANGILSVEARDLGTGRTQAISVTATSGLKQAEVDALVQDGERFKETDQLRRDLAEMRNQAETLIYTTEQALEGYADLLEPAKLESVHQDVQILKKMLETGANLDALRDAYSRLENATFEIAEAMYAVPRGRRQPELKLSDARCAGDLSDAQHVFQFEALHLGHARSAAVGGPTR